MLSLPLPPLLAIDGVLRTLLVEHDANLAEPNSQGSKPVKGPREASSVGDLPRDLDGINRFSPASASVRDVRKRSESGSALRKVLWSSRIQIGVLRMVLQSSLNVALDATMPLEVAELIGWDQRGQGLIFTALLLPSFHNPSLVQ
jgi:hypothetical protein